MVYTPLMDLALYGLVMTQAVEAAMTYVSMRKFEDERKEDMNKLQIDMALDPNLERRVSDWEKL